MSNFNFLLEDLEAQYPKHKGDNYISNNYGRPMRIELKNGVVFGVAWFRWEHQNGNDLQNEILCFNSGNRDIDKFQLKFDDIKSVEWA